VGKSRKHRHVDRNAHRAMAAGPPGHLIERRAAQTIAPPICFPLRPPLAAGAIPLPSIDEPLVLYRKPPAAPPDFRSRYPAKKTKKARVPAPPSAETPRLPVIDATPPAPIAPAPHPKASTPPVLLLTFQPAQPKHAWFAEQPMPLAATVELLEPAQWADDVFLPPPKPAPLELHAPSPAQETAAATPLPRAAAITAWKSGPLDAIGRWLRTRTRRLALRIAPAKRRRPAELARLRAENAYLRQQLRALERLQA